MNSWMRTEEQLIDEGLVSRIECMGEKLEDAKMETTLTVPALFLDLGQIHRFFFRLLNLLSSIFNFLLLRHSQFRSLVIFSKSLDQLFLFLAIYYCENFKIC